MNLLVLENTPIFEQLKLEEALLRASKENFCIINTGSTPAIVMGISGKAHELLNIELVKANNILTLKRFSGGGTVFIDPMTVFVTFIMNTQDSQVLPQPKPIHDWARRFYEPVFPGFQLRENDYVFEELKFGGNAQYIQRDRWLHHTSFLWDYHPENMRYLLLPPKRPTYRGNRSHTDFLCSLRSRFPEKETLLAALVKQGETLFPQRIEKRAVQPILEKPHRKATCPLL